MTEEEKHKPQSETITTFGHLRKAALAAAFLMAACGDTPDPVFALREATARLSVDRETGADAGFGTAFAIGPHTWATAAHVVEREDRLYRIGGERAVVVHIDETNDTAVLWRPVPIDSWLEVSCSYEWPEMTDQVTTYGYSNAIRAVGPDRALMARGIVASDHHRAYNDGYFFPITGASIAPGASGSAWVNEDGEVVGIVSHVENYVRHTMFGPMPNMLTVSYAAPTFSLCSWMRDNA